ncbi:MAG: multidrug resistance protein [Actinobacteria bacterium]|nr:MAG: multidrug resistance protein [Actinomycetota bacterium]
MNREPNRIVQEKGNRTMLIGLILTSVILAGFAQITLKTGVNHVVGTSGGELHLSTSSLRSLLSSPIVWGGLVLFGLSAVVWLFALSRASLSFAYPFAALSYVLILVFSVLVLHETVQPLRWLGVALIVTGIVLVAQTPHT